MPCLQRSRWQSGLCTRICLRRRRRCGFLSRSHVGRVHDRCASCTALWSSRSWSQDRASEAQLAAVASPTPAVCSCSALVAAARSQQARVVEAQFEVVAVEAKAAAIAEIIDHAALTIVRTITKIGSQQPDRLVPLELSDDEVMAREAPHHRATRAPPPLLYTRPARVPDTTSRLRPCFRRECGSHEAAFPEQEPSGNQRRHTQRRNGREGRDATYPCHPPEERPPAVLQDLYSAATRGP